MGRPGSILIPIMENRPQRSWRTFLRAASKDTAAWDEMSEASLQRIKEKYTWALYADRLMTLTRVYRCAGFLSLHCDISYKLV